MVRDLAVAAIAGPGLVLGTALILDGTGTIDLEAFTRRVRTSPGLLAGASARPLIGG